MKHLSSSGLKWLKGFHLLTVSCWIGGAISLILLSFIKTDLNDGGVLFGINKSIHQVDMAVVVIPGALGCFFTGLIYSIFSKWGFFKHNWITIKWIITIAAILFGTFYLGPWETQMMNISGKLGLNALKDTEYLYNQKMNFIFGIVQISILIFTVFISIFKPWKKKKTSN